MALQENGVKLKSSKCHSRFQKSYCWGSLTTIWLYLKMHRRYVSSLLWLGTTGIIFLHMLSWLILGRLNQKICQVCVGWEGSECLGSPGTWVSVKQGDGPSPKWTALTNCILMRRYTLWEQCWFKTMMKVSSDPSRKPQNSWTQHKKYATTEQEALAIT